MTMTRDKAFEAVRAFIEAKPRKWPSPAAQLHAAAVDAFATLAVERDRMLLSLQNVMMLAQRMRRRDVPDAAEHLLRFCREAGAEPSILRDASDAEVHAFEALDAPLLLGAMRKAVRVASDRLGYCALCAHDHEIGNHADDCALMLTADRVCIQCGGAGELLHIYPRPGGPPGNQVVPCEPCGGTGRRP